MINSNDTRNVADVGERAPRTGVILLNIGTPNSTSVEDIRAYLERFLWDDGVIDIDDLDRKREVIEGILSSRPAKSAETYKKIWHPIRGSPLLYHTEDLKAGLQRALGDEYDVYIGFQYSEPSLETAMSLLTATATEKIVLVPMFPHFAEATVAAILTHSCRVAADLSCTANLQVIPPFYNNPLYLEAASKLLATHVEYEGHNVDHVVFSFHGIPERHCSRTDMTQSVCMKVRDCCSRKNEATRNCYRAQCLETATLLAESLRLRKEQWSIAFSSRKSVRGNIHWTQPYTDELLPDLAQEGKTRVAICSPSFTADNTETLAELGIEGKASFERAGGKELILVPCMNSSEAWINNLAQIILKPERGANWAM